ncbi:MAG TPA: hypothetical protein VHL31_06070 [Geminicoccus sp.]|jgi:hypothetical protein|uniref:hypothetical protein n=1 Tax=Geminicoccus sp. TaxID=2024832 RepID=UPI002E350CBD|nr:hypothetical protein [Geminicoccus sp.]HEX2525856.1 hypothetical protein [Geminicoccus sp.]
MKLQRRLHATRYVEQRLREELEAGELDEALQTLRHLRAYLRQALGQVDRLETMIDPPWDPFRHGRKRLSAPDDLP